MAGWLPVLQTSARFHHPAPGTAGLSRFDYVSGNLPIATPQFHVDDPKGLIRDTDWVELPCSPAEAMGRAQGSDGADAAAASASSGAGAAASAGEPATFWWHRRYRSKRSEEPAPSDNGREGAFEGEAASAPPEWFGAFDADSGFVFFCHARSGERAWRRPEGARVADYVPQWRFDPAGAKDGGPAYVNQVTGSVVAGEEPPEGCDADAMELPPSQTPPEHAPPRPRGAALEAVVRMRVLQRAYENKSGSLRKAGGGTRLFGSKGFKPRWVVIRSARLSYFADEAAARKLEKRKDRELHLDNYVALPDPSHNKRLALHPILPRTHAAAEMGQGAAEPARSFQFEARDKEERDAWLRAMGGDPAAKSAPIELDANEEFLADKKAKKSSKRR